MFIIADLKTNTVEFHATPRAMATRLVLHYAAVAPHEWPVVAINHGRWGLRARTNGTLFAGPFRGQAEEAEILEALRGLQAP